MSPLHAPLANLVSPPDNVPLQRSCLALNNNMVPTSSYSSSLSSSNVVVRSVWASNFVEEFEIIGHLIGHYNHLSIDTEFPGTVIEANVPTYQLSAQAKYTLLKANVDNLKLIQLGLTLSDDSGNLPFDNVTGTRFIWEFNFKGFDPSTDPNFPESVELLRNSGIDIERNLFYGVDVNDFACKMLTKKILYNPNVTWITFQGAYDFAFVIKALVTSSGLPTTIMGFMRLVQIFFGKNIYDVKYMMRHCNCYHGGLEKIAKLLGVENITGKRHLAGWDSLLTLQSYMKMKEKFFGQDGGRAHAGSIFGLEVDRSLYFDYSPSPFSFFGVPVF